MNAANKMMSCRWSRRAGPTIAAGLLQLCLAMVPPAAIAQATSSFNGGAPLEVFAAPLSSAASDVRLVSSVLHDSTSRRQSQPAQRKDSLANGAVIGAVVGALGLGAVGGVICKVQQEEGGGSCVPDFLRIGAIGAGIGAGLGIGIDAALARSPGITVAIKARF
jgi:hypothetical protein